MARIVVVGSVAVDEVVGLGERLRIGGHQQGAWRGPRLGGGGANTAVPLAHAGHQVVLVAAVGDDEAGRRLVAELAAAGVDTSRIASVPQPTTRSLILVDGAGERTIVNVARTREEMPPERLPGLRADCLYVRSRRTDLGPLLGEAVRSSVVVAHVPPWTPGSLPAHVLVTSESDLDRDVLDDPFTAGRAVAGDTLQTVVVTRGAEGAVAHGADRTLRVAAPTVVAVDTTGAGDAFAAGMLHGLVSGASMHETLTIAAAWGAEATRWESSVLPREAVARLLQ